MEDNKQQNAQSEVEAAPSLTVEEAIANLQQREDLSDCYYAAWWLGRFRVREPAAIAALITALEDNESRSPDGGYPLQRNAAKALGKLGDRQAVEPLINRLVSSDDFYVRESAAQALEMLEDVRAIPALIKRLDGGIEAATPVPGKPHLTQPYEAIIEALGKLRATEAIPLIIPFLEHSVEKVQFAAARAMYQLTEESLYAERLMQGLKNDKLQVRRAALLDIGMIGYLPAAELVSQTPVANSLRLISLKGILEFQLKNNLLDSLSPESIQVLGMMDDLL